MFQHSPLLWALQVGRHEAVLSALRIMYQEACEAGCTAVLLSGEDFENFLIDDVNHRHFEQLLEQAGFQAPEWIWVERDPVNRRSRCIARLRNMVWWHRFRPGRRVCAAPAGWQ